MSSDQGADEIGRRPTAPSVPAQLRADGAPRYNRRGLMLAGAGLVAASVAVVARLAGHDPTPPGPPAARWREVFFDDFAGSDLDPAAWSRYDGPGGQNVGRRDPRQVVVSQGELRVVAMGDVSGGLAHRQNHVYGKWEVRARIDSGSGYGPAILLWPQSDRWPQDGEIDISEIPEGSRRRTHFTVHWGRNNAQAGTFSAADFTRWHVFGCEWEPGGIRYLLDGRPQWTLRTPRVAIPDKPMHLAIQLDVGAPGLWIPPRDAATPQPVVLHVDWVRVSKRV